MAWSFSVDNWDVEDYSLCKISLGDGVRVGGNKIETVNAGSVKNIYFHFGDFEESSAECLGFYGDFESSITVEGALLEAFLNFFLIIQKGVATM